MDKLLLVPVQAGYAVDPPQDEVLRQSLQGGAGFYRADILGGTSTVTATWVLSAFEHDIWWSFFRSSTGRGADPFLLDLIVEGHPLGECTCYFMPGTIHDGEPNGDDVFTISATLEVEAAAEDLDFDSAKVVLYEAAGNDPMGYLDLVRLIVETWPEA